MVNRSFGRPPPPYENGSEILAEPVNYHIVFIRYPPRTGGNRPPGVLGEEATGFISGV